jgi:hypothetical protein
MPADVMSLTEASMRLQWPHWRAYNAMLTGDLGTPVRHGRQWFVRVDAVERLAREQDATADHPVPAA